MTPEEAMKKLAERIVDGTYAVEEKPQRESLKRLIADELAPLRRVVDAVQRMLTEGYHWSEGHSDSDHMVYDDDELRDALADFLRGEDDKQA